MYSEALLRFVGFGKSKKLGSQGRGESLGESFFFFFVGFFPLFWLNRRMAGRYID
jgi:hypothetical protein